MFLPDYLKQGMALASLDGMSLVKETRELLPQKALLGEVADQPLWVCWGICLLLLYLSSQPQFAKVMLYADVLLFLLLGLLGCFMLFMWLGTAHQVCAYNRNLWWAFPLHLIAACMIPMQREWLKTYARYAAWLVLLNILYSSIAVQQIPSAIWPVQWLVWFRLRHYAQGQPFRWIRWKPSFQS